MSYPEVRYPMNDGPGYCTACGTMRVEIVTDMGRYDYRTGKQMTTTWYICPMRRTWWWFNNGHDKWLGR